MTKTKIETIVDRTSQTESITVLILVSENKSATEADNLNIITDIPNFITGIRHTDINTM